MKLPTTAVLLLAATLATEASANPYATAKDLGLMEGLPVPEEKAITKDNALLAPPYNRYSYLHMRTFYPTDNVENAKVASTINRRLDAKIDALKIKTLDKSLTAIA